MALTAPTNDLTGNTIASTYDQLLILDNAAGIVENTLKIVSTQLGHSALQIDDEKALIKGVDTNNAAVFQVTDKDDANILKCGADTLDVTLGDDLLLNTDGSVIKMGAGADATFTHGGTGLTIAATPISINSTGDLTLDSSTDIVLDADGDNITMKAGSTGSGLDFIQSGTGDYTIKNLTSDKDIIFNVLDGVSDTEVMRIDGSTSNVGIRQPTPQSDNGMVAFLHIGSSSTASSGIVLEDDEVQMEIESNGGLNFTEGSTSRMIIKKTTGNVGIGTPEPAAALTVNSSGTTTAVDGILIEESGTDVAGLHSAGDGRFAITRYAANNNADMRFNLDSTVQMCILENGKVGIGTSSPAYLLELEGDNTTALSLMNQSDTSIDDGDTLGTIYFGGRDEESAGTNVLGAKIVAQASGLWETGAGGNDNDTPTELQFWTSPDGDTALTQKMVIRDHGYVGINEASPSFRLDVTENRSANYAARITNSNATDPQGLQIVLSGGDWDDDSGTDEIYLQGYDNDSANFNVYGDGDIVSLDGTISSDKRIKENIVDATSKLEDINKLKVRNFNHPTKSKKKRIGFVADEFEEVFPSLIKKRKVKKYGVEYNDLKHIVHSALVPMLVKAVQELSAKVTALENA